MYVKNRDLKRPFSGIWNRLEPRPLQKDFSRVLRAEVYDPLWMLNRQWQFGEFKGEDTGSAVFAHIQLQHTKMSRYTSGDGSTATVESYTEAMPLEVKVESEGVPFDLKMHLQISLYFKKLLQRNGLPVALYQAFLQQYKLAIPTFNTLEEEAKHTTQSGTWLLWKTAANKGLLNGEKLYGDIKDSFDNGTPISNLIIYAISGPNEEQALFTAATALTHWLEKTYVGASSAWQASRLEYQFANAVPNPQGGSHQALVAEEYYQGKLDWFAYDVDVNNTNSNLVNPTPLPQEDTTVHTENLTVLPSPVRFAGMPVPRWWEMEEGYINLGNIAQDTVEVPKVLLAQFGLVFNNDWQMIPMRRPIGSWSEVASLVVTDVFGQKTAVTTANNATNNWSMYSLNHKDSTNLDGRLLIPPTLDKTLEGEPIEVVCFARDEMANQVWAIEQKIPSLMGEGMDGKVASEAVQQQLAAALLETIPVPPNKDWTAYYPLNGDAMEYKNFLHGTLHNVVAGANPWGQLGGGLEFAGNSNSYIALPNAALLKPNKELTIGLWVKFNNLNAPEQYLVFTENNELVDKQAYALSIRNNKFRGYKNAAPPPSNGGPVLNSTIAYVDSTTVVQANQWYQVTFSISATALKLYVNGNLEATVAATHGFDYKVGGAAVILGGTNNNIVGSLAGTMSEVYFHERALTGEEVMELYNNGQPFPALVPQALAEGLAPADYIYHYLLSEVPENWIPFVPVRLPITNELVLQRGKMQRNLPHLTGEVQYIYPSGAVLKEHNHPSNLYFLKEEEVPRAGVKVSRTFQRTRWIDGKVFTWLGRQKKAGHGGVNSHLQFDGLEAMDNTE